MARLPVCRMAFLHILLLALPSTIIGQNSTEVSVSSAPAATTAAECLAYVYVAWVYFIYSLGLGLEPSNYHQLLLTTYSLIPVQCGGSYTTSPPLPPTTVLTLLLTTSTFSTTPDPLQGLLQALGARGGIDTRERSFQKGLARVRKEGLLPKYLAKILSPFKPGGFALDRSTIRKLGRRRKNRKGKTRQRKQRTNKERQSN